jgi:hypothetical protein
VTGDKLEEALVVASPTAFAALADELQAALRARRIQLRRIVSGATSQRRIANAFKNYSDIWMGLYRTASKPTSQKFGPPYRQFPLQQFQPRLIG